MKGSQELLEAIASGRTSYNVRAPKARKPRRKASRKKKVSSVDVISDALIRHGADNVDRGKLEDAISEVLSGLQSSVGVLIDKTLKNKNPKFKVVREDELESSYEHFDWPDDPDPEWFFAKASYPRELSYSGVNKLSSSKLSANIKRQLSGFVGPSIAQKVATDRKVVDHFGDEELSSMVKTWEKEYGFDDDALRALARKAVDAANEETDEEFSRETSGEIVIDVDLEMKADIGKISLKSKAPWTFSFFVPIDIEAEYEWDSEY